MKEALQQAEEAEEEESSATTIEGSTPVQRDSKGKPILSPEQKAKKLEKEKKIAVEVGFLSVFGGLLFTDYWPLESTVERRESEETR